MIQLNKFKLALLSLLMSSYCFAADGQWTVNVAPYLWAVSMNGTTQVGSVKAHVDENFSNLLDHLNWGAMLWVDADKDKWYLFGNALYASLSASTSDALIHVNDSNKFGIFGAGIGYEVYKACFGYPNSTTTGMMTIDPYLGLRYTLNDTTVTLHAGPVNLQASENQNWTDPVIGAHLHFLFTQVWSLVLDGDIGGTNTTDHYSYSLAGLLGYHPQFIWSNTTIYLGYRLLDQHYSTGSGANYYNWNMKLFGPILGFNIAF